MAPRPDPDVVGPRPNKSSIKEKTTSKVSFNTAMDVVLIPSRCEYFKYSCDLWWGKADYSVFQQSAFSEIRLFALCECIEFKKARQKLYQPNGDEKIIDEPVENVESNAAKTSSEENSPSTMEQKRNTSKTEQESPGEKIEEDDLQLCVRLSNQMFSFEKHKHSMRFFPIHLGIAALTLPILGFYLFEHIF